MWKKISEYIEDNRAEIDLDEPRIDLWMDIEEELHPKVRKHWFSRAPFLKVAAIVLFSVGISYVSFGPASIFKAKGVENIAEAPSTPASEAELDLFASEEDTELQEVETYYAMQVAKRQQNLEEYNLSEYTFSAQYLEELNSIDAAFEELRQELEQEGLYEHKIEAMVQTYELKIKILEQMLRQIRKAKKKEQTVKS